jgi:cation transport protein ChaC
MTLTREKIEAGWIREMITRADLGVRVLSDAELAAAGQRACLARLPAGADLWLFAYGSLIWNPCCEVAETRTARVVGWHRRFCLWTPLGRGTPERPGLMLGLERGGSCRGVALRIEAARIAAELDVVWRREMVTGAYVPAWVRLATAAGPVDAVAFTINRRHVRYAGRLDEDRTAAILAHAEGPLGTNREYLFNTVAHLAELGLGDRRLERLCGQVRRLRGERAAGDRPPEETASCPKP